MRRGDLLRGALASKIDGAIGPSMIGCWLLWIWWHPSPDLPPLEVAMFAMVAYLLFEMNRAVLARAEP